MSPERPPIERISRQSGCLPALLFMLAAGAFVGLLVDLSGSSDEADQSGARIIDVFIYAAVGGFGYLVRKVARDRALETLPSAEDLMSSDPRPPVLYLRSFDSDADTHTFQAAALANPYGLIGQAIVPKPSFEQGLAFQVWQVSPFVALGPPALGAARFRTVAPTWQEHVRTYLDRCRLIVMRVGEGEGLKWELEELRSKMLLSRLIVYLQFPSSSEDRELLEARYHKFGRWFAPLMGVELPLEMGRNRFLTFHGNQGRLWMTLAHAMRDLGLDVESSAIRATYKGMLPGASNRWRRAPRLMRRIRPVFRWAMFMPAAFMALTACAALFGGLINVVKGPPATLIVLSTLLAGLSGGVVYGRLTAFFDVPGGRFHFLFALGLAVWSFLPFVHGVSWTLDSRIVGLVLDNVGPGLIFFAASFLLIPLGAVVYGLSESEHRQRSGAK